MCLISRMTDDILSLPNFSVTRNDAIKTRDRELVEFSAGNCFGHCVIAGLLQLMRCYLRTTDKVDNENVLDFHRRGMISLIYTDFSEMLRCVCFKSTVSRPAGSSSSIYYTLVIDFIRVLIRKGYKLNVKIKLDVVGLVPWW